MGHLSYLIIPVRVGQEQIRLGKMKGRGQRWSLPFLRTCGH